MTRSNPEDEATRALVKRFCGYVFRLKQVHYMCWELFYKESAQSLMERTAHAFFLELNKILIDYFLLRSGQTDRPSHKLRREV